MSECASQPRRWTGCWKIVGDQNARLMLKWVSYKHLAQLISGSSNRHLVQGPVLLSAWRCQVAFCAGKEQMSALWCRNIFFLFPLFFPSRFCLNSFGILSPWPSLVPRTARRYLWIASSLICTKMNKYADKALGGFLEALWGIVGNDIWGRRTTMIHGNVYPHVTRFQNGKLLLTS